MNANFLKTLSSGLLLSLCALSAAQAQTLTGTRTSAFTYYGPSDGALNGLLKSETVEPDNAQLCVTTTYEYDSYGNKQKSTTANCAGASAGAVFSARSNTMTYAAVNAQTIVVNGTNTTVAIPAGAFATSASNALLQDEKHSFDPRFGAVLTLTGPNELSTTWVLDDFGRKTKELRADNTSTVTSYCFIARNNGVVSIDTTVPSSPTCPTPATGEVPADAFSFVHSESKDTAGVKMGPFVRVYADRLGREIRSVTEGFDGASQPSPGSLVVKDTVYNQYGAKVIETQPYFLATGSSTTGGSNNVGATFLVHDVLGRPTDSYTIDASGQGPISTSSAFAALGFASGGAVSYGVYIVTGSATAHAGFDYTGLTTTTTNDRGQTRKEGKNVNGELVRVTDASGAQLAHQRDAFGNLVATKDALQNTLVLSYDIRGRKTQMVDPDKGTWKYDYNALGELVWQQSPNQLAQGAAVATTMAYDLLGRVTKRSEPEYVSDWYYDKNQDGSYCMAGAAIKRGAGKLCESKTSTGINHKLVYDSLGRPINNRTTITAGPSFAGALAYDATTGRLASQTYPTGLQVGYGYTASRGFLQSITLLTAATVNPLPNSSGQTASSKVLAAGTALWTAQVANAWGKAEKQLYGNNVIGNAAFEAATGRVASLTAGASNEVLNQQYSWDSLNNLTARIDQNGDTSSGISTGAVSETFVYGDNADLTKNINRLSSYTVSAPQIPGLSRTVNLQYNALGMLLYKSDVGVYAYGAQNTAGVKPHALQSVTGSSTTTYVYDANGNLKTASAGKYRSVTYTSFDLPDSQGGIQGPGGLPKYVWQYDENHARIQERETTAAGTRTTWYLHPDNQGGLGFENEIAANGAISNRHFLTAGGQVIGVLVSTAALPVLNATDTAPPAIASVTLVKMEYWHKDHLGSIVTTTDHNGAVTQRYAYDPFGKRRYVNGSYDEFGNIVADWSSTLNWGTARGFTGHEHLDDIGLVNMNGRIFDPTLGVFLQADPMIQDPDNLQNYNRYGYCFNNPLTCTDPTGYSFLDLITPGVPFRYADPLTYYGSRAVARTPIGYELGSIAIGTVSAIYCQGFAAVCNGIGQAAWAGFAGRSFSESMRIGIVSGLTSQAFTQVGDWAPIKGPNASPFLNLLGHAVVGCASSAASGGSCKSGAVGAGFSAAFTNFGEISTDRTIATVQSAMVGGIGSVLSGGTFASGARSGAFGYLFNKWLHGEWVPDGTDDECSCRRTAEELGRSLSRAIDKLGDELQDGIKGLQGGIQYSLRVTVAGTYMDVRGNPVQLDAGDVWKYGETTQIAADLAGNITQRRYSGASLVAANLILVPEYVGTQMGAKFFEAVKLNAYVMVNGQLPPGNRTTR